MCLDIMESVEPKCLTGEGFSIVRRGLPLTGGGFRYTPLNQDGHKEGYCIGIWYRAEAGVIPASWRGGGCYASGFHIWRTANDAWS